MYNMPKGFSSAAIKAGLKNNDYDLAIIKSELPSTVSALYTQNKLQAAPIQFSKNNDKNKIELLIVNSKSANSLTGKKGYQDVLDIAKHSSDVFKCKKENIMMASTGIIGIPLEIEKIKNAITNSKLNTGFDENIIKAIQTRDRIDKVYKTQLQIEDKTANFLAIAKGSSIVHPNMATVLLFIFTDLNVEKKTLNKAFKYAVEHTLNRISIDGETSTNDMALIMANGALENKQINEKNKKLFLELQQKLEEICAVISKMILLDGEGMSKTIMVSVKKAKTQKDAFEIASKISKSNLVKILFISNEIEHRKLLSTIGNMNVNVDKMSITVDNINIYKNGKINENQDELKILNNSLNKDKNEHHIILDCGYNTKFEDYYYFTDISQEYISIHSSYNI